MNKRIWAIGVMGAGILIVFIMSYGFSLGNLSDIAQILGVALIVIAIAGYWHQKKQDMLLVAADQISFFRTTILTLNEDLAKLEKAVDSKYKFPGLKIELNSLLKNLAESSAGKEQYRMLKSHDDIYHAQVRLFNALEEFAVKVIHFDLKEHPVMGSIKTPYVLIVEQNAVTFFFQRKLVAGKDAYFYLSSLYDAWKNGVNRKTVEENWEDLKKAEGINVG